MEYKYSYFKNLWSNSLIWVKDETILLFPFKSWGVLHGARYIWSVNHKTADTGYLKYKHRMLAAFSMSRWAWPADRFQHFLFIHLFSHELIYARDAVRSNIKLYWLFPWWNFFCFFFDLCPGIFCVHPRWENWILVLWFNPNFLSDAEHIL